MRDETPPAPYNASRLNGTRTRETGLAFTIFKGVKK